MAPATLFGMEDEPRGPYVRVALHRRAGREESLTYRAPSLLPVGQLVEVPLASRTVTGIVIAGGHDEILDGISPARVKPLARVRPARLPEPLVDLARWIGAYYVCPLGIVLATMMPAAVRRGVGTVRELKPVCPELASAALANASKATIKAWDAVQALDWNGSRSAATLARALGHKTSATVRRLQSAGLLESIDAVRPSVGIPDSSTTESRPAQPIHWTATQRSVIDGIAASLGSFGVHLLHGVTGSGKTEVYMALAHHALQRLATTLILVPEIALTPQLSARFIARFGPRVAVLHSGLSAAERSRQWARAADEGHEGAALVIGARSAVFAPLPRLGLIIVDEEHATDYKQDQAPRFHARDVAIKRAQMQGCAVVLGSATPSLESWANAASGRYSLWRLPERVAGGRLPRVEIIDLARERRDGADASSHTNAALSRVGALGPTLRQAIADTLRDDGQIIILINRRGHAHYVCCPSANCGWVLTCAECDASMVIHRSRAGRLARCHHCLAEQIIAADCPACGRRAIAIGSGTQRVEEELARFGLEPGRSLIRADGDTMRTARDWTNVLAGLANGSVRVLVGTQMVAKGLDFPNVRLVGVVNADTALALPDFRADERTFQLVSQVAGRAGRGEAPGRVIVQTVNPRQPAILLAAAHDFESFARREIELRRAAGLPPVSRLARIVVRDEDLSKATARAERLAEALRRADGLRVEGPAPCPIARIAGYHRVGLDAYAESSGPLTRALGTLRAAGLLISDARTAVDVDPVALT
ncbi:MAG: primosomal protein N' [Phycisphaerales bacterium]